MRNTAKLLVATALTSLTGVAAQAEDLSLQLNWKAGGDHAPIYYALQQGWYANAGVDLEVRQGTGSGAAAKALQVGQAEMAIIDTPTALQFLANGAPMKGVFVAYNDNAAGLYWKTITLATGLKISNPTIAPLINLGEPGNVVILIPFRFRTACGSCQFIFQGNSSGLKPFAMQLSLM